MLNQFHVGFHSYNVDVVDIKIDSHCSYRVVTTLLGMGEESWIVMCVNLLKELSQ